ncbi:MAG: type III pantothenate kinase [bacterium]|nr:MAG: type III pantothenate kinase [bacterium]
MLLAVDIGNTNTALGVFRETALGRKFRFNTNQLDTGDEIALKISSVLRELELDKKKIKNVIIGSVVPALTQDYIDMARNYFGVEPVVVGPGVKTGISILYDNPREVGADRIANAVGGFTIYGGPLIIVDLGTAITFDAVSDKAEYIGGVIAPGIDASLAFLVKKAAQLPQVSLQKPERVIGKITINSMQSGTVYGFSGMIDAIVRKMKTEMDANPKVIATGGQSGWLMELSETIDDIAPDLTLHGLAFIYSKNTQ